MEVIKFERDKNKNIENQKKHCVSFDFAQYGFADPKRIIAKDLNHSGFEDRFYCFGQVDGEILTVRFTFRNRQIRLIGAGYWRKGKKNL